MVLIAFRFDCDLLRRAVRQRLYGNLSAIYHAYLLLAVDRHAHLRVVRYRLARHILVRHRHVIILLGRFAAAQRISLHCYRCAPACLLFRNRERPAVRYAICRRYRPRVRSRRQLQRADRAAAAEQLTLRARRIRPNYIFAIFQFYRHPCFVVRCLAHRIPARRVCRDRYTRFRFRRCREV